ncbi:MAG: prepilin-type N-terminal cleavage/methylation domain-containing protein [Deltaproteobacteria bacterium]|jgi:prepilin-type N-terminal cleavage/methylation domain-containing protein|nr:prepilin-type N-terminal cleavage/methylation domain-containing protein [Deltaproteobacteria bacterium]
MNEEQKQLSASHIINRPRQSLINGFTLIEVIIALAVIAVWGLATVFMLLNSIKGKNIAANITFASAIASNELERLKSLNFDTLKSTNNYELLKLDSLSKSCLPDSDCSKNIFDLKTKIFKNTPTNRSCQVELEVSWRDSTGPHSVLYSAFITDKNL